MHPTDFQKAVIFDLDGTLIDSAPAILSSLASVLRNRSIKPTCKLTSSLIGPPLDLTLKHISGISDQDALDSMKAEFMERYDTEGIDATECYPGIEALLGKLHEGSRKLHIVSNKRIAPTRILFGQLGWNRYFDAVYTLDSLTPLTDTKATLLGRLLADQHLNPDRCTYVGDKLEDGLAADANRVPFILAGWGYGAFGPNHPMPANWTRVNSPDELALLL